MEFQPATLVSSTYIAKGMRSMKFQMPENFSYKAGQHCDLRLTAPSGYQAQRSYSIASSPTSQDNLLEFGIQILDDGEVSSYLDSMTSGDQLEIKGPIGEHFILSEPVEDSTTPCTIWLIGAGSGVVPLMSMARYLYDTQPQHVDRVLLWSSHRKADAIPWEHEREVMSQTENSIDIKTFITRQMLPSSSYVTSRITEELLQKQVQAFKYPPDIYICGRTNFVESVASTLVDIGINSLQIKTERFG